MSGAYFGGYAGKRAERCDGAGKHDNVDLPMLGLLRHFYSPERKTSKTMFTLIEEDKIDVLRKIINEKTGGLNKPDTGIAFAVPTTFVEGLNTNK